MMPELKTRRQWRKQDFHKVLTESTPAAHRTIWYIIHHYHDLHEPMEKDDA
jgi:hypothetical protein